MSYEYRERCMSQDSMEVFTSASLDMDEEEDEEHHVHVLDNDFLLGDDEEEEAHEGDDDQGEEGGGEEDNQGIYKNERDIYGDAEEVYGDDEEDVYGDDEEDVYGNEEDEVYGDEEDQNDDDSSMKVVAVNSKPSRDKYDQSERPTVKNEQRDDTKGDDERRVNQHAFMVSTRDASLASSRGMVKPGKTLSADPVSEEKTDGLAFDLNQPWQRSLIRELDAIDAKKSSGLTPSADLLLLGHNESGDFAVPFDGDDFTIQTDASSTVCSNPRVQMVHRIFPDSGGQPVPLFQDDSTTIDSRSLKSGGGKAEADPLHCARPLPEQEGGASPPTPPSKKDPVTESPRSLSSEREDAYRQLCIPEELENEFNEDSSQDRPGRGTTPEKIPNFAVDEDKLPPRFEQQKELPKCPSLPKPEQPQQQERCGTRSGSRGAGASPGATPEGYLPEECPVLEEKRYRATGCATAAEEYAFLYRAPAFSGDQPADASAWLEMEMPEEPVGGGVGGLACCAPPMAAVPKRGSSGSRAAKSVGVDKKGNAACLCWGYNVMDFWLSPEGQAYRKKRRGGQEHCIDTPSCMRPSLDKVDEVSEETFTTIGTEREERRESRSSSERSRRRRRNHARADPSGAYFDEANYYQGCHGGIEF